MSRLAPHIFKRTHLLDMTTPIISKKSTFSILRHRTLVKLGHLRVDLNGDFRQLFWFLVQLSSLDRLRPTRMVFSLPTANYICSYYKRQRNLYSGWTAPFLHKLFNKMTLNTYFTTVGVCNIQAYIARQIFRKGIKDIQRLSFLLLILVSSTFI